VKRLAIGFLCHFLSSRKLSRKSRTVPFLNMSTTRKRLVGSALVRWRTYFMAGGTPCRAQTRAYPADIGTWHGRVGYLWKLPTPSSALLVQIIGAKEEAGGDVHICRNSAVITRLACRCVVYTLEHFSPSKSQSLGP
jgi:hypothetical protein